MKIDSNQIMQLSTGGTYTLFLHVPQEVVITAGKLGKQKFPTGYYSYTGSALGKGASLKHRIGRHLKKEKKMFWHIDYLLAEKNVSVNAIVAAETKEKIECTMNSYLKKIASAKVQVKGFGASDCKNRCESHLLYFPDLTKLEKIIEQFVRHLQSFSGVLSVRLVK